MIEILYSDRDVLVCIKPAGVLSTDEPNGLPELVRKTLGDESACVRTVHRLDRVVSGLMVLARNAKAASLLSKQIMSHSFEKEYLAVIHGTPEADAGRYVDLLLRDSAERKTYVTHSPEKGAQEAVLDYEVLGKAGSLSKLRITLLTGRTHQIRAQLSSRGLPVVGDRKYGSAEDDCNIALWSYRLAFDHPFTGERMDFYAEPYGIYPWTQFSAD